MTHSQEKKGGVFREGEVKKKGEKMRGAILEERGDQRRNKSGWFSFWFQGGLKESHESELEHQGEL